MIGAALAMGVPVRRDRILDPSHPLASGLAVALLLDSVDVPNLGSLGGRFRPQGAAIVDGGMQPIVAGFPAGGFGLASVNKIATPIGPYTLFARLRLDADPNDSQANIMSLWGDEGGDAPYQIRFGDSGAAPERRRLVTPSGVMSTGSIPLGTWCTVAVSIGPSGTQHYLDAAPNGGDAVAATLGGPAATMRVGSVLAYARPFLGPISHLYVWHGRALTSAEISTLHAAPDQLILNARAN